MDPRLEEGRLPLGTREHLPADRAACTTVAPRRRRCPPACPSSAASCARSRPTARRWSTTGAARGVLLEALQGRAVHGHLARTTSRRAASRPAHRLRRQERLPDVGRRRHATSCPTAARSGIANLYRLRLRDRSDRAAHATSTTSTSRCPRPTGGPIVFVHAGRLTVLDLATRSVREVTVDVPSRTAGSSPSAPSTRGVHPLDGGLQRRHDSPSSRRAATSSWSRPTSTPRPRNLTRHAGRARARSRSSRPTARGSRTSPTRPASTSSTSPRWRAARRPSSSRPPWTAPSTTSSGRPDGTKILFGNKDFALFYVDVATKKLIKFASSNQLKNDEFFWEVCDYSWSPDSQVDRLLVRRSSTATTGSSSTASSRERASR